MGLFDALIDNNTTKKAFDILEGYLTPTADLVLKQAIIRNMNTLLLARFLSYPGIKLSDVSKTNLEQQKNSSLGDLSIATGLGLVTDLLSGMASDQLFGDSEPGRVFGTLFSSGLSSAGNTITNNIIKGTTLVNGLGKNVGQSLAGTAIGLGSNYIGRGITALGGDSKLARGIGQGVATGLGTVGGEAISNLFKGQKAFLGINNSIKAIKDFNNASKAYKSAIAAANSGKLGTSGLKAAKDTYDATKGLATAAKWNLAGLGGQIVGTGLLAALGPSKEYGGKYGGITQGMDTAYDLAQTAVGFIPGWGQVASGMMALNKGLSNVFGSTDGMTTQDAILGSAFMPAPVKWLNMAGAKTTGNFYNQSWLNSEKANSFMGNAFGNLGNKFDLAREEAGKTYGLFSRGAYNDALDNLNFANSAWNKVLAMSDQNELLKIRSLYMSSINNQRYALLIQGGFNPIFRGKQGMKIFNNATNHNIGMRLLSAAALIDNKQIILSAQGGTKILSQKSLEELVLDKQKAFEEKIVKPIMIGYDKNRAFTLTNAGSLTGAHLSEEMIEYIMSEAEKAGIDLQTALGIVGAESTFGNPTDDKSSWKISSGIRREFNNVYPGTSLHINTGGDAIDELKLVNFYDPLENQNPYTLQLNEAKRRAEKGGDYNKVLSEGVNYADKLALQPIPTGSLMLLAFEYFKKYGEKYNPNYLKKTGQSYVKHVLKKGKEALQSPEIQQAINNITLRRMLPLKTNINFVQLDNI